MLHLVVLRAPPLAVAWRLAQIHGPGLTVIRRQEDPVHNVRM